MSVNAQSVIESLNFKPNNLLVVDN
jgi:hypothetical protein